VHFASDWEAGLEQWDPEAWAERSAATGARYVVLVTKHMDGYCLWPTQVPNPRRAGWNCRRDVVGELSEAVRGAGMRFGVYYSGGLDSTFKDRPMGSVSEMLDAIPRGDLAAYAEAQVRELIARYRPSVLWNDIGWTPPHFDVRTPEYAVFPDVRREPWECVRGMNKSFGYNACSRPQHFLARDELLWMLIDIVAKGGNLLLNVGPRGVDAQIPDEQITRLEWLGDWVGPHRDAIAATRPWVWPGTTISDGRAVRYTARDDTVYAFVRNAAGPITFPDVRSTPTTAVETLDRVALQWRDSQSGITLDLPAAAAGPEPTVVAPRHVEARPAPHTLH